VFAPLSLHNIQGNGLIDATKVQFWVQDVRLQGSATFLLQPDPASGLPPPGYGSALIR
jgi:hypothetical protein